MSWLITPTQLLVDDQDALTYLAAVETADGQALESGVRLAVNAFVKGCKADGIWPAIKASCILAGARTLAGALVPLAGAAPTNVGPFGAGDYNRKTGLKGNATSKILNTNFTPTARNQNNIHASAYVTEFVTLGAVKGLLGNASAGGSSGETLIHLVDNGFRVQSATSLVIATGTAPGLYGVNRNSANVASGIRASGSIATGSIASQSQLLLSFAVFGISVTDLTSGRCGDWRIPFYSIGESLDLALLDTRVTTLVNALSAAIP